jgi:hypothetical protein
MNISEKIIQDLRITTGYTGPLTFIEKAMLSWKRTTGYDVGLCTSRRTTKRHPAFKRVCFKKAFFILKPTDGTRRERRAAAWVVARKQAEESRANLLV